MDITLFGHIGEPGLTGADIKRRLAAAKGRPITVRIDSPGGSVLAALSIYDAFKAYAGKKTAIIESTALSAASFIACAFDRVEITPNGYLMMHNPVIDASGDDQEMASKAESLRKLKGSMIIAYEKRSKFSRTEVTRMMAEETFFDADEALQAGFVDSITSEASPTMFSNELEYAMTASASKRRNSKPVSKPQNAPTASATKLWGDAILIQQSKGKTGADAIRAANKLNPGLRVEMLREVNADRPHAPINKK